MSEVILKVDHLKKYFPVKAKMFSGSKVKMSILNATLF